MAQDAKKSFVLFYDYRRHLQLLTDAERGQLLMALFDYGETGKEPELDGAALMAFSFIAGQMDRDAAKYERICQKRREAGRKGGSSKGSEQEAKKPETTEGEGEKPKDAEENQAETKKANANFEKQTQAKKANACFDKQTQANKADNENDNDTENETDNENDNDTENENENENDTDTDTDTEDTTYPINNNTTSYSSSYSSSSSSSKKTKKKAPKGAEAEEAVTPYKDIVNLYHEICQSYPRLKSISSNRKKMMAARWKEYEGNLETFRELFTKAEASSFMKGKSERGWTADFNWMMNSDNMAKVLEGKYDNKESNSSFDIDDFFEAATRRALGDAYEPEPKTPATAGTCSVIREKAERLRAMLA